MVKILSGNMTYRLHLTNRVKTAGHQVVTSMSESAEDLAAERRRLGIDVVFLDWGPNLPEMFRKHKRHLKGDPNLMILFTATDPDCVAQAHQLGCGCVDLTLGTDVLMSDQPWLDELNRSLGQATPT